MISGRMLTLNVLGACFAWVVLERLYDGQVQWWAHRLTLIYAVAWLAVAWLQNTNGRS